MRIIVIIGGNILALFLASYYIPGVIISGGWKEFVLVGLIFSIINVILKPVLKLIFGPLILLTVGIFTIVINMGVLWITDIILPQMSIAPLKAIFLVTLLISAVNFITHILFRK